MYSAHGILLFDFNVLLSIPRWVSIGMRFQKDRIERLSALGETEKWQEQHSKHLNLTKHSLWGLLTSTVAPSFPTSCRCPACPPSSSSSHSSSSSSSSSSCFFFLLLLPFFNRLQSFLHSAQSFLQASVHTRQSELPVSISARTRASFSHR